MFVVSADHRQGVVPAAEDQHVTAGDIAAAIRVERLSVAVQLDLDVSRVAVRLNVEIDGRVPRQLLAKPQRVIVGVARHQPVPRSRRSCRRCRANRAPNQDDRRSGRNCRRTVPEVFRPCRDRTVASPAITTIASRGPPQLTIPLRGPRTRSPHHGQNSVAGDNRQAAGAGSEERSGSHRTGSGLSPFVKQAPPDSPIADPDRLHTGTPRDRPQQQRAGQDDVRPPRVQARDLFAFRLGGIAPIGPPGRRCPPSTTPRHEPAPHRSWPGSWPWPPAR